MCHDLLNMEGNKYVHEVSSDKKSCTFWCFNLFLLFLHFSKIWAHIIRCWANLEKLKRRRFFWKTMILYGLSFGMHTLQMCVWIASRSCFNMYCWSSEFWYLFDGKLCYRLMKGCMRRWLILYLGIKQHRFTITQGNYCIVSLCVCGSHTWICRYEKVITFKNIRTLGIR